MRTLHRLAVVTLLFTLAVILWGAFVRATGSGAGCGEHWPVCNGVVIPRAPSVATLIEYTHRLTSGLALLFVVALFVQSRRLAPRGHPVRRGAFWSLFFMLTEAAVGAGLVLFALVAGNASVGRAIGMSVHLINTFLLVGALTLTVLWAGGAEPVRWRHQGWIAAVLGAGVLGLVTVGVSGAIAALGDTLFPAASLQAGFDDELSATAHVLVRLRVWHPVLAIGVGGLTVASTRWVARARPSSPVERTSRMLVALYGLQLVAGFVNVLLLAPVWMQLVHLLLADGVWMGFVVFAARALQTSESLSPFGTRNLSASSNTP